MTGLECPSNRAGSVHGDPPVRVLCRTSSSVPVMHGQGTHSVSQFPFSTSPTPASPALRIQRMPSGQEEFGDPADYPYMCVASPSSHDTTTTRAWYEEDAPRRQRYYAQVPQGPVGAEGRTRQSEARRGMHAPASFETDVRSHTHSPWSVS